MKTLVITNGQSAVHSIAETGIQADILPWEDVLHDGPVPGGISDAALARVRAEFLSSCGWGDFEEILDRFEVRDNMLSTHSSRNEVVCWFEHDIYDMLQVWQVLDRLSTSCTSVSLICLPLFVSHQSPELLKEHFRNRIPVSRSMFDSAKQLWAAFCSNTPLELINCRSQTVLPFTQETIDRWAEMYPSVSDGLSRIEHTVLEELKRTGGSCPFSELFRRIGEQEEAAFLGDSSFQKILDRMSNYESPLVEVEGSTVHLESSGKERLGDGGWKWESAANRWLGGVEFSDLHWWTYDRKKKRFNSNKQRSGNG